VANVVPNNDANIDNLDRPNLETTICLW
jgi:hypothetical protein